VKKITFLWKRGWGQKRLSETVWLAEEVTLERNVSIFRKFGYTPVRSSN